MRNVEFLFFAFLLLLLVKARTNAIILCSYATIGKTGKQNRRRQKRFAFQKRAKQALCLSRIEYQRDHHSQPACIQGEDWLLWFYACGFAAHRRDWRRRTRKTNQVRALRAHQFTGGAGAFAPAGNLDAAAPLTDKRLRWRAVLRSITLFRIKPKPDTPADHHA